MTRLKDVSEVRVSNVDKKSYSGEIPVRLCNYTDVYYGDVLTSDSALYMQATASPHQARDFRLQAGDTVLTKDSETADDIGVSAYVASGAHDLVCGYHLAIVRPSPDKAHPKYLSWFLRSVAARGQMAVAATGVTRFGLRTDALASLYLELPTLGEQRRIAAFLDDQVALLDRAIGIRNEQIDLVTERGATLLDAQLASMGVEYQPDLDPEWASVALPRDWQVVRLSRVLRQLTNGYVGPTRDILRDSGVRYIQGTHIKNGQIDFERRPFYVDQSWHVARARINLRTGDVLIVQTGDIGRVAVVPPDFGEASCHALLIARADQAVVSGRYLGAYLGSAFGYQSLISRATGALHPHLEGGIRDVPVIVPPLKVQESIVSRVDHLRTACMTTVDLMVRQNTAFQERKQALITAAVTGQFDVTTARTVA